MIRKYKVGDIIEWTTEDAPASAVITLVGDLMYYYTFLSGTYVKKGQQWEYYIDSIEMATRLKIDVAKIYREILNET